MSSGVGSGLDKQNFEVGDWIVTPELNLLIHNGEEHHVEPKVMQVLMHLCAHPHRLVPKEQLISAVWPDTFVSDDVLVRCISMLRKLMDDDRHNPRYIQTISKRGYRLLVDVNVVPAPEAPESVTSPVSTGSEPLAISAQATEYTNRDGSPARASSGSRRIWFLTALTSALVLATAAALGGVWLRYRPVSPAASSFRMTQFTSYPGEQSQPAFSPDGKTLAYIWAAEDGHSRHIYLQTIGDGGAPSRVTSGDGQEYSPVWSPDGLRIAYLSRDNGGLGLYIASVQGARTAQRVFIPEEPTQWEKGALSWSPDGLKLLLVDHPGAQPSSSVFEINLASREAHAITSPPSGWEGDLSPAYSPDGKRIAFVRASETAVRDIYWIPAGGGYAQRLTTDGRSIDSFTWSSDSQSVLYSSNRSGKYALWRMKLGARQPERLSVGTEDAFEPAVAPNGCLAYMQASAIWSIERLVPSGAGQALVEVLSSTLQDSAPAVSPDGKRFAFQSWRSGSQEIWIASQDGRTLSQLTHMGGALTGSPSWSHSGRWVAFDSRVQGHSHVFILSATGGKMRQLTSGTFNDIVPRWSANDQSLYFRSNRGGRWQLWKMPFEGGSPQPVTSGDGIAGQESLDGQWLYFARGEDPGLWRVSTQGGEETRVLTQPEAGYWAYWTLTPRGILYLDLPQFEPALKLHDPTTGKDSMVAPVAHKPPPYSGLSADIQGDVVMMTGKRDSGSHITLVEGLPNN